MGEVGAYVLVVKLDQKTEIAIGRLGTFEFPRGYYLYVGSARGPGGLDSRLARHLSQEKRVRWHIDYLLREAGVVEVWKASSPDKQECLWARALLQMPGARIPVSGFGSSDCRCPTHLGYFASPPSLRAFTHELRARGAEAPQHSHVPNGQRPASA